MRVLHVTDFYLPRLGGIEVQVSALARQQAALGHEVTVLTSSPAEGDADRGPVRVVRLPELSGTDRATLVDPHGVDVVHAHVGVGSPLAIRSALAAERNGLPTLVTVHSLWTGLPPLLRPLAALARAGQRRVRWSAVSRLAAGPVRRSLGGRVDVAVLGNGVDVACWRVDRADRPPDVVVLAAVMRLAARKRPLPLLAILEQVRSRTPAEIRIEVLLAGDGPRRRQVEQYLRRHGMAGWVHVLGRQTHEQIREVYRRADAFVAPAVLESFGIAALEARCAGVPVVTRSSGIAEFVAHGRHGLTADSDAEMADALVGLCTDVELRRSLDGPGGTAQADWPSVLERTEELYDEAAVLAGRRTARPVLA